MDLKAVFKPDPQIKAGSQHGSLQFKHEACSETFVVLYL